MNTVNLYTLTRFNGDIEDYSRYEQNLSDRAASSKAKEHERRTLSQLVDLLYGQADDVGIFDGFVSSYSIPHIGKEFDLLRVSQNAVLNIELKSDAVPLSSIEDQLKKNAYYLSPLKRKMFLYAFVGSSSEVYKLGPNEKLVSVSLSELVDLLQNQAGPFASEYDELFSEHKYLVSPVNDVVAFLESQYFLTQQQLQIKNSILKELRNPCQGDFVYKIEGAAGTGKTLLLYDLARCLGGSKKSLVIHCGVRQKGHDELNRAQDNFRVIPIKGATAVDFAGYGAVLLDESHRCYERQLDLLVEKACNFGIPIFFFLDKAQTINRSEVQADIAGKLDARVEKSHSFELSKKIRSNPEIANFIRELFSLKGKDHSGSYSNIDILFASSKDEAFAIIEHYQAQGYQFINYTPSQYTSWSEDMWCSIPGAISSHEAIGQEFDKVILPMSNCFFFEEGRLMTSAHPYHNYILGKMLFQGMTRAVSKLAILVYENIELANELVSIVNGERRA